MVAAAGLEGDRGLGPLLAAHPELVHEVAVDGPIPDVDTPADLAALDAASRHAERPMTRRSARGQARGDATPKPAAEEAGAAKPERRIDPGARKDPATLEATGPSASAPTASRPSGSARPRPATSTPRSRHCSSPTRAAPASPRSTSSLEQAGSERDLARHRRGRRPLRPAARAQRVREVIAVEPSASMRRALRTGMDEHGIGNVRVVAGRLAGRGWPSWGRCRPRTSSMIAHVGYDIEAIGPFLDAMERATRDRCVAMLTDRSPASVADPFWPLVHGEDRVPLPALPDLLELLARPRSRRRWSPSSSARRGASSRSGR